MTFKMRARYVAGTFAALASLLTAAHIVAQAARFISGNERMFGLVRFFLFGFRE